MAEQGVRRYADLADINLNRASQGQTGFNANDAKGTRGANEFPNACTLASFASFVPLALKFWFKQQVVIAKAGPKHTAARTINPWQPITNPTYSETRQR